MHLGIQQQKNVPNHYIVLDSLEERSSWH